MLFFTFILQGYLPFWTKVYAAWYYYYHYLCFSLSIFALLAIFDFLFLGLFLIYFISFKLFVHILNLFQLLIIINQIFKSLQWWLFRLFIYWFTLTLRRINPNLFCDLLCNLLYISLSISYFHLKSSMYSSLPVASNIVIIEISFESVSIRKR